MIRRTYATPRRPSVTRTLLVRAQRAILHLRLDHTRVVMALTERRIQNNKLAMTLYPQHIAALNEQIAEAEAEQLRQQQIQNSLHIKLIHLK